jgi:hypothetical protein
MREHIEFRNSDDLLAEPAGIDPFSDLREAQNEAETTLEGVIAVHCEREHDENYIVVHFDPDSPPEYQPPFILNKPVKYRPAKLVDVSNRGRRRKCTCILS